MGDLVRVIEGTHDHAMPRSRTGLVVEVVESAVGHAAGPPPTSLYVVQFGASTLRFHPMWLEKIS